VKQKALFVISVVVLLSLLLTACGQKSSAVKIATDATYPPFETVDENSKELTGFDVELMNAIAAKAGITIEWSNIGFDAVLTGVSQCQYDAAAAAITITEERKQNALFSDPYINAGQIVTVKINETAIKSKDDLAGKKIGAQLGTTGEIEAQAIPDAEVKPYDSVDLAFLDLANGQLDAVITDYPTTLGYVAQDAEKIMTVGEVFTDESYGFMVCKDKADLVTKFNKALAELKADGTIAKLEQKWLAGIN